MAKKEESKEPLLYCQIITNCAGVKRPQFSGNKPKYKNYRAGEKIKGREHNMSDIPGNFMPCIKTIDGFLINASNVMVLGEEQDAEIVDENAPLSEKLKKRIERFSNASGGYGLIEDNKRRSKYMMNGLIAGAVIFLTYSIVKGGPKIKMMMIGGILGAVTGRYISKFKPEE